MTFKPSVCTHDLPTSDISRIIEMAWEDRTTFDAIKFQFGLSEQEVINLMRSEMKLKSFKMWRKRVQGRKTKHEKLRTFHFEILQNQGPNGPMYSPPQFRKRVTPSYDH